MAESMIQRRLSVLMRSARYLPGTEKLVVAMSTAAAFAHESGFVGVGVPKLRKALASKLKMEAIRSNLAYRVRFCYKLQF